MYSIMFSQVSSVLICTTVSSKIYISYQAPKIFCWHNKGVFPLCDSFATLTLEASNKITWYGKGVWRTLVLVEKPIVQVLVWWCIINMESLQFCIADGLLCNDFVLSQGLDTLATVKLSLVRFTSNEEKRPAGTTLGRGVVLTKRYWTRTSPAI